MIDDRIVSSIDLHEFSLFCHLLVNLYKTLDILANAIQMEARKPSFFILQLH